MRTSENAHLRHHSLVLLALWGETAWTWSCDQMYNHHEWSCDQSDCSCFLHQPAATLLAQWATLGTRISPRVRGHAFQRKWLKDLPYIRAPTSVLIITSLLVLSTQTPCRSRLPSSSPLWLLPSPQNPMEVTRITGQFLFYFNFHFAQLYIHQYRNTQQYLILQHWISYHGCTLYYLYGYMDNTFIQNI